MHDSKDRPSKELVGVGLDEILDDAASPAHVARRGVVPTLPTQGYGAFGPRCMRYPYLEN